MQLCHLGRLNPATVWTAGLGVRQSTYPSGIPPTYRTGFFLFACARVFTWVRGLVDIPGRMTVSLRTRKMENIRHACLSLEISNERRWPARESGDTVNSAGVNRIIIALHYTTIHITFAEQY